MKAREGWRACYGIFGVSLDALAIYRLHADRQSYTRLPMLVEVEAPESDLSRRMRATGGGGLLLPPAAVACARGCGLRACLNMLGRAWFVIPRLGEGEVTR